MKKYVLVVAVAAALFSCSGNPKADATQTDKNKQEPPKYRICTTQRLPWITGVFTKGHYRPPARRVLKRPWHWTRIKPLPSAPNILTRKTVFFNDKGTYTLDGNVLTTKQEGGDITYYKVEEGQLKMLDQQKQPITGDLAKFYILKQTKKF